MVKCWIKKAVFLSSDRNSYVCFDKNLCRLRPLRQDDQKFLFDEIVQELELKCIQQLFQPTHLPLLPHCVQSLLSLISRGQALLGHRRLNTYSTIDQYPPLSRNVGRGQALSWRGHQQLGQLEWGGLAQWIWCVLPTFEIFKKIVFPVKTLVWASSYA